MSTNFIMVLVSKASEGFLCLCLSISAGCAASGYKYKMNDEVDTLMKKYHGNVPGASLLVIKDGTPVVRRSWGMSDLEDDVRATPATNYRLASVTKQFTAAAILLLREDRKLSLDDRVRRWLPSLPQALDSVTIEHLLTHTSGIIDYEDAIPKGTTEQVHDADVLRLLESQDSTYWKPGSKYQYSNSGYSLLALIVERASGKSFATFLHDRIFMPLGMKNTVAYEKGISTVANRAFGYTRRDSVWVRKDQSLTSAVLGDGGIYSSIDDMAKWDAALYDSRLLSDESRRLAFTPHTATDKPDIKYGFGWRITGESLWHSGETSGFRNVIVRYPSKHLTVVMLTNRDDPPPYETALAIAKIYGVLSPH
jgi:CubicO group peptidase (beta-lactamase class C family)